MTEWRIIPSFPHYAASRDGRVRREALGKNAVVGRELTQTIRRDGYVTVTIQARPRYVHRLVCEAFHGKAGEGMVAAHEDGVRGNNRAENLRWATYQENEADKARHGTKSQGSRNASAKLDELQVCVIRSAYRLRLGTQKQLAEMFGVAQTKISEIVNHRTWRHVK